MSDIGSQILPFALVPTSISARNIAHAAQFAVWPRQTSTLALLRQNAELRAQNAALTQALASRAEPMSIVLPRPTATANATAPILLLPSLHSPTSFPTSTAAVQQCLTNRQRQVLAMVLSGHPSKNIATDLGISQRTVENHRAAIMRRTGATSVPALARLVIGAAQSGDCTTVAPRHTPPLHAILCQHSTTPQKAPHAPR